MAKSTALQQRKFQAADQPPATDLYEARLVEIRDFTQPFGEGGPSDHPTGGVVVTGVERVGNYLMLDLASAPLREYPWKVMGGSDPGALMDDLSQQSGAIEGPEGTGVYKLMVPVPAGSEKYFVQIGY
ncbi:MAG: hypothetical protein EOP85_20825 [Verrucomicrobiaceae bacterium]|nr:MAG: hypothetical protein EOP85_20825 [Verrucomicrobiaceae bacterium]